MVGGKQIEVMGVISDEDYAKGRCFQNAAVETPAETVLKAPVYRPVSKSFTKPALKGGALTDSEHEKPLCKPRHDLNAPGIAHAQLNDFFFTFYVLIVINACNIYTSKKKIEKKMLHRRSLY